MKIGAGKLVLREHNPRRVMAIRVGLSVLAVVALWLTATIAYRMGGNDNRSLRDERDQLLLQLAEAEAQVSTLRERVAILERGTQIASDAGSRTREELTQRDQLLADLRAEVAFYESLVVSGNSVQGVQIHSLRFAAGPAGAWTFQLTLTHDAREAPEARGRVEWVAEGLESGEMRRLSGAELGLGNGTGRLEYAFKYFQVIRGDVLFPADFVPRRVDVRLVPADAGSDAVERSFEWREIVD